MADDLDEEEREFICEAKGLLPKSDTLLYSLSNEIGQLLDPSAIAANLVCKKLITKDIGEHMCNTGVLKQDRINTFLLCICNRGNKLQVLLRFHSALVETIDKALSHADLARLVQLNALKSCGVLSSPISVTEGCERKEKLKVVKEMARLLPQVEIDRDTVLKLCRDLCINELGSDVNDVAAVFQKWIQEKMDYCTPEKMVKTLLLTKGLGQFVSKIACPWNPPEVRKALVSCGNKIFEVIKFLGFEEFGEEEDSKTAVKMFLKQWKFPDCGKHNTCILESLKTLVIPESIESEKSLVISAGRLSKQESELAWLTEIQGKQVIPPGCVLTSGYQGPIYQFFQMSGPGFQQIATPQQITPPTQPPLPLPAPSPLQITKNTSPAEKNDDDGEITGSYHDAEEFEEGTSTDDLFPLHSAVLSGSLNDLKRHLQRSNVNAKGRDSKTPLMLACAQKKFQLLTFLLKKGADTDLKDRNGLACLHYREVLKSKEAILQLYSHQANIEIETNDHMTPLAVACSLQLEEGIKTLVQDCKANINGSPYAELTPLSFAVQNGNEDVVKCIIKLDQKLSAINAKNKDESTALIKACELKQTEIGIKLIEAGASVRAHNKDGCTAVFMAALNQVTELLQLLIIQGADLNKPGTIMIDSRQLSLTPLSAAASVGCLDAVQLLVKNEAYVNYTPVNGANISPVLWAALKNHYHVVDYLLKLNETRKDFIALKPVFECVVNESRYNIGALLLSVLGGEEKALQEARQDSVEMEGLVAIVVDGVLNLRGRTTEHNNIPLNISLMDNPNEEANAVFQYLQDFVKYSVETFVEGRSRSEILSDPEIDQNHRQFFADYFKYENQPWHRFNSGPGKMIFNSRHFTGVKLARVLNKHGRINFIADLPATLLYIAMITPDLQHIRHTLDGKTVIRTVCGDRFMAEVEAENLFSPVPIEAATPPMATTRASSSPYRNVEQQQSTPHYHNNRHNYPSPALSSHHDNYNSTTGLMPLRSGSLERTRTPPSIVSRATSLSSTSSRDLPSTNTSYASRNDGGYDSSSGGYNSSYHSNSPQTSVANQRSLDTRYRVVPARDGLPEIRIRCRRIQQDTEPTTELATGLDTISFTDDYDGIPSFVHSETSSVDQSSDSESSSESVLSEKGASFVGGATTDISNASLERILEHVIETQDTQCELIKQLIKTQGQALHELQETQRQILHELKQQTELLKKKQSKKRQ